MKFNGLLLATCFLLLFCCFAHRVGAQTVQLKAPLSADDEKFLKKELIKNFCDFDPSFACSLPIMNVDSLAPQLQANSNNITLLRKGLKGNINDAAAYLLMADIFSRLKMPDSVDFYEKKGLADYDVMIAKKPDSTKLYEEAGLACLTGGYTDRAVAYYSKELAIKPTHSAAVSYLAMAYLFKAQLDSMLTVITAHLHQYPDDEDAYYMLPFYSFFKLAQHQNDTVYLKKLPLDSATRVPLLDNYYAGHKDSFDIKFLHYEALQVLTVMRVGLEMTTGIDSETFEKDRRFSLKPEENEMLTRNMEFFQSCLNNKSLTYRYCSNKYIAVGYLFLNQPQKAIPNLKEAIKLFPKKKASALFNADEDYNNLLAAYAIIHDTNSLEKLLLEKIKILPKVDPEAGDYTKLAEIAITKNKLKAAQEYCDKALAIDAKNTNAITINGLIAYLNKNYQKATDAVNKAYTIDNTNSCIYLLYGSILVEQNNHTNAYETFKLAIKNGATYVQKDIIDRLYNVKQ